MTITLPTNGTITITNTTRAEVDAMLCSGSFGSPAQGRQLTLIQDPEGDGTANVFTLTNCLLGDNDASGAVTSDDATLALDTSFVKAGQVSYRIK